MRRLTLCLALMLPLALASSAAAKEVVAAKVCGASDCREVKDERALAAFHEGGPPTDPPDEASGWYRADVTVKADRENFTFAITIVPHAGLIRGEDGGWMPVSDTAVAQFRRVTRSLEAFPAAKLTGLDEQLPQARVDQVFDPARESGAASEGGSPAWPWIAGAALLLGGLALLLLPRLRRGPGGSPKPVEG
jgi:hypothetical protein